MVRKVTEMVAMVLVVLEMVGIGWGLGVGVGYPPRDPGIPGIGDRT
jgi:hypothetical protein